MFASDLRRARFVNDQKDCRGEASAAGTMRKSRARTASKSTPQPTFKLGTDDGQALPPNLACRSSQTWRTMDGVLARGRTPTIKTSTSRTASVLPSSMSAETSTGENNVPECGGTSHSSTLPAERASSLHEMLWLLTSSTGALKKRPHELRKTPPPSRTAVTTNPPPFVSRFTLRTSPARCNTAAKMRPRVQKVSGLQILRA
mmetsp:Transcript_42033/g.111219  ORF Transcript_42033/g.111219 Transcript_42033/m.111219 type:complete len:202 (-) Transcript_42033:238-843(-)